MKTNRIFAASYQRGLELTAAGCPIDRPDALAGRSDARRKPLRVKQLAGYTESAVYKFVNGQAVYVIAVGLETDHTGGIIIDDWRFEPPWQNQAISWDYAPLDLIPKSELGGYRPFLDSRLMDVLNDRRLLRRGYPVEGLLCGCAFQEVPESARYAVGKLTLTDDAGDVVSTPIKLTITRLPDLSKKRIITGSWGLKRLYLTPAQLAWLQNDDECASDVNPKGK